MNDITNPQINELMAALQQQKKANEVLHADFQDYKASTQDTRHPAIKFIFGIPGFVITFLVYAILGLWAVFGLIRDVADMKANQDYFITNAEEALIHSQLEAGIESNKQQIAFNKSMINSHSTSASGRFDALEEEIRLIRTDMNDNFRIIIQKLGGNNHGH